MYVTMYVLTELSEIDTFCESAPSMREYLYCE